MSAIQLAAMLDTYRSTVKLLCVNCIHYIPRHIDDVDYCGALISLSNPINGDEIEAISCLRMRFAGPCGLDAKGFEPL